MTLSLPPPPLPCIDHSHMTIRSNKHYFLAFLSTFYQTILLHFTFFPSFIINASSNLYFIFSHFYCLSFMQRTKPSLIKPFFQLHSRCRHWLKCMENGREAVCLLTFTEPIADFEFYSCPFILSHHQTSFYFSCMTFANYLFFCFFIDLKSNKFSSSW